MKLKVTIVAIFVAVIGLGVWAFIDFNNWQKACIAAGGEIEERYEYTYMNTSYTYNANGTIATVMVLPEEVYSYHCWVNHQEIEVNY